MVKDELAHEQPTPYLRQNKDAQVSFGQFRLIQGTLALDASLSALLLGRNYRSGLDLKRLKSSMDFKALRTLVAFLRRERTRLERQLPGVSGLPQQLEIELNRRSLQGLAGRDMIKIVIQVSGSRALSPRLSKRSNPHAYLEGLAVTWPPSMGKDQSASTMQDSPEVDIQGEFLRRMSHELRTPLHAICGIAQMLFDQELNRPGIKEPTSLSTRRLIEQLLNAGEQMQDLVGQLLDLSYIRSSKLSSISQPFNLNDLLMQCWQPYFARAEEKGLSFEYESDLQEETILLGDWRLLFQLIRLLLSNAIKFTDCGRVVFSISHQKIASNLIELSLDIKDTGIGIAKEDVEKIFQPFIQSSQGDQRSHAGSGLGLYLCEQIAQALGSHIEIQSRPGFSTCFYVHLTFQISNSNPVADLRSGASPINFEKWRIEETRLPLKILLVDDNEVNLAIIKAFLRDTDVQVTAVTSGQEALAEFSSEFYDVVLMDLQMPQMDGYQTTKRMRHLERAFSRDRSVIIAVSASCFSEDVAKARASGCDDHVAKPLTRQGLFSALERHRIKLAFNRSQNTL